VTDTDDTRTLLARARELEAQAARRGDDSTSGLALRKEAAGLRGEALGEKPYPVVICSECYRVTGWLDVRGRCDSCLRQAQLQAAYGDPQGGFVTLGDNRPVHHDAPEHGAPAGLSRLLGGRAARERAVADAWLAHVDPDTTGPIDAEDGYELERPHRDQVEAADGTGMLIRFRTATHRFAGRDWVALETTTIGRDELLVPTEYSAGLPPDQLVEAWLDYRQAVDELNRERWSRLSADREAARLAREAHEDTMRRQRDTAELLDDS